MMFQLMAHAGIVVAAAAAIAGTPETKPLPPHPVIELRQYKLVSGKQDEFVPLFDSKFVESQEAVGIRLISQNTDHDRRDRFTWVREFPNMAAREKSLHDFYFGPVWLANRDVANPMLDDNDNVMLLRAARPDSGFGPSAPRPAVGAKAPHGMVFVTIEYLWKNPNEGFSNFFLDQAAPAMRKAGLPVLGAYVSEEEPNNFPRLPVRSSAEKVFVWFTKAHDVAEFDRLTARLHASPQWKNDIAPQLAVSEERPPLVLRLDPTPRSALR